MSAQIRSVLHPGGTYKLNSNVMSAGMEMMFNGKTGEALVDIEAVL